jgi:uncharacterized protein
MRRIWLLLVLLAPAARGASFDCNKARTPVEKAICADPHLSSLDGRLARAYGAALEKAGDDEMALRQDQRDWLRALNAGCTGSGIGACIEKRETERIQMLSSGAAMAAARAKVPPPPPVCQAAIADLNKLLPAAAGSESGDPVNLTPLSPFAHDLKEVKKPTKALASEATGDENTQYHVLLGDATLNGIPMKVVDLSPDPSRCSGNTDRYEFWSRDLGTMLGKFDATDPNDALDLDIVPSDLLGFEGKPYVLVYDDDFRVNGSMTLKAVQPDWSLLPVCQIGLVRRRPEIVLAATDRELCDAVAAGQVETVSLETLKRPSGDGEEVLRAKATVDLYNDGHPVTLAISNTTGTRQDHCQNPWEDREEHPVVLNANGAPIDRSIEKDVQANEIGVIRFKGVTYVDGRATEDTPPPTQHDVWRFSRTGAIKVCSLLPVRYAAR